MKEKIMLVDDEEIILQATSAILETKGYECKIFSNAKSALAEFMKEPFSVVISDLAMPEMSGQEFATNLLEQEQKPIIIIMSSQSDLKTVVQLMQTGVYDYVVKPCNATELVLKVKRAFELARLKKLQWMTQREREIRVEHQLNWNIWKENTLKRSFDKADSNIIGNLNTNLTQGAGVGANTALIEMIKNSSTDKGEIIEVDKELLLALYENANFTKKFLFMLDEIERVINDILDKENYLDSSGGNLLNFIVTLPLEKLKSPS